MQLIKKEGFSQKRVQSRMAAKRSCRQRRSKTTTFIIFREKSLKRVSYQSYFDDGPESRIKKCPILEPGG